MLDDPPHVPVARVQSAPDGVVEDIQISLAFTVADPAPVEDEDNQFHDTS